MGVTGGVPLLGEAYVLELFSIWRKFTQSCAEKFSNKGFKSSFEQACFSFLVRFFFLPRKQKEKMNIYTKNF